MKALPKNMRTTSHHGKVCSSSVVVEVAARGTSTLLVGSGDLLVLFVSSFFDSVVVPCFSLVVFVVLLVTYATREVVLVV